MVGERAGAVLLAAQSEKSELAAEYRRHPNHRPEAAPAAVHGHHAPCPADRGEQGSENEYPAVHARSCGSPRLLGKTRERGIFKSWGIFRISEGFGTL